jgi:hypothetical protein
MKVCAHPLWAKSRHPTWLCEQACSGLTRPPVRFAVYRGNRQMGGNIFINYRRDDSSHVAGRLHQQLAKTFGGHTLFMDVDNIPVGINFEEHLKKQVAQCDAMLAVRHWSKLAKGEE